MCLSRKTWSDNFTIFEGTSEIQRMIIANEVSKRGLEQLVTYRVAEPAVHA